MLVNEDSSTAAYQITAYDDHSISINGQRIEHSVIIFPTQCITDWPVRSLETLRTDDLSPILTAHPEIVLIGSGLRPQRLDASLRAYLENQGMGVECMTTKAACRSYMALLAEDRSVGAILFLDP